VKGADWGQVSDLPASPPCKKTQDPIFLNRCGQLELLQPRIEGVDVIREAPAMTVRQNLGELLNEVQYRNGRVLITKAGKPVAALIDVALFERIRKLDEEFDTMADGLAKAFAGIAPGVGRALIDEALRAARKPARRR
jgi:prevent-host-death family protein